jgi:uncharacterized membrane protein YbhN (UPF0104 family)
MLSCEQTAPDFALAPLDLRAIARRAAVPVLLAGAAVAAVLVLGGRVHEFTSALSRVTPGWGAAAVAAECLSLAGYVLLL